MEDYIERVKIEREKANNIAYQYFDKHIRQNKEGLFCFFEGEDDSTYYISRIKTYCKEQYFLIDCKGKEKVLKVHKLINYHREYDKYKKAYFVDRDFDPPLAPMSPPIYETPCYSVENLYVSVEVFKEILQSAFALNVVDEAFEKCVELYKERQKEFHEAVLLLNSWIACLRTIRHETGEKLDITLNDTLPKGFVVFSLEKITQKYDLQKITTSKQFAKAPIIPDEVLQEKIEAFRAVDQCKVFRGKYELEFLYKMLNALIEDAANEKKYLPKKRKSSLSMSDMLMQFSQYAETPECLITYLKTVVK